MEDVGAPAASKSGGLLDLARRSENNAERDCARLMVNQFELGLPIPKTKLDTGVPDDDLSVPVVRLRGQPHPHFSWLEEAELEARRSHSVSLLGQL